MPTTSGVCLVGPETCSVAKLGKEQLGVVVGDEGVAEGDPRYNRRHDAAVGAREVREEPVTHYGHDPGHLVDDVLGLDIHDAPQRVGVLEIDDEAQDSLEACVATESGHRLGHPGVVFLLLVGAERL